MEGTTGGIRWREREGGMTGWEGEKEGGNERVGEKEGGR